MSDLMTAAVILGALTGVVAGLLLFLAGLLLMGPFALLLLIPAWWAFRTFRNWYRRVSVPPTWR